MATKEAQKRWRDRSRAGQIRHCPLCGKRLRQESKIICQACWLKTPEGREYNRQKVNRHRSKVPKTGNVRSLLHNVWFDVGAVTPAIFLEHVMM